ncbi:similar to TOXICOS EN LEVADURA 2 [Actinidia rufa]|uniref:RING-type E3 ubiquitin transferase n=1 Tax=Actinidia rufa TaxID=165716 RepID=A0A7J0GSG7_9ERIC|nr:similar to TOXICOS EN LEVADURA 2 [Actinidia rufa]
MDDNSAAIARNSDSSNDYSAYNGNRWLISLSILVVFGITVAICHFYIRWLHQQRHDRQLQLAEHPLRRRSPLSEYVFNFGPTVPTSIPHKGLERAVLKSLPTSFYNPATHGQGGAPLECAVCLSEFGNNDLIRLLPKCNHCFHILCIDMWFYSHSNCPLCRVPVKPVQYPVIMVTGSGSGLCPNCQRDDYEAQVGGSSSDPGFGGRKNSGVQAE